MKQSKVLVVFGTRPEAIKLCSLVRHLRTLSDRITVRTCVTAQHRDLLDQVLSVFDVQPDYDLDLMKPRQSLYALTSNVISGLEEVLNKERPDMVVVQGDTTTTFVAALGAFYGDIPVAHVEAGLRTGDLRNPFPEESNRVLTSRLASLHFAATPWAEQNLLSEGIPRSTVVLTGNTVIDALYFVRDRLQRNEMSPPDFPFLNNGRRVVLVTAHRRESFGSGMNRICEALASLAERDDIDLVFPVHPNPNVREPVEQLLGNLPRVHLIAPLDYAPLVALMLRSYLILTDSGGIQEEAPALGKPVLVLRDTTERPEGVEAGTARLVGTVAANIVRETNRLLDDTSEYDRMAQRKSPYGDGRACEKIGTSLLQYFERKADNRHQ